MATCQWRRDVPTLSISCRICSTRARHLRCLSTQLVGASKCFATWTLLLSDTWPGFDVLDSLQQPQIYRTDRVLRQ